MKKFAIEIFEYPHFYEIEAEDEEEAKKKASEKFHDDTFGKSIYETKIEEITE
jgi:hypothetical protein